MNPFNIFTNKNDLVKILALGGMFALIFSLIYPIEKKKELDLRKVELNASIRQVISKNIEAQELLNQISNDKKIEISEKGYYKSESKRLKSEIIDNLNSVKTMEDEIIVLEEYINEYGLYTNLFFWTGLISSFIGLLFWSISGIKEHQNS